MRRSILLLMLATIVPALGQESSLKSIPLPPLRFFGTWQGDQDGVPGKEFALYAEAHLKRMR